MSDEILENPITGESMRILESSSDTFRAQYTLRAHGAIPGEHFHPGKAQRITVLSGEIHLRIDGKHQIVRAGETATIPAGGKHFQWNPTNADAVVIEEIRPAGRIHDFFKVLFGLARDGRTDNKGFPTPVMAAALFSEFGDSIMPAPLPLRLLFRMLGPVAGVMGYRRQIGRFLREGHWA